MQKYSVQIIKTELQNLPQKDLVDICFKLMRYKIENKELLGYLLFDSNDINFYIEQIKLELDTNMHIIHDEPVKNSIKKIRKTLRIAHKRIKFSSNKKVETAVLIGFLTLLKQKEKLMKSLVVQHIYERQLIKTQKALQKLDEDLQFDFSSELNLLTL